MSGFNCQDRTLKWLVTSLTIGFILIFEILNIVICKLIPDVVQSSEESYKTDIKRTSRVRQLKNNHINGN